MLPEKLPSSLQVQSMESTMGKTYRLGFVRDGHGETNAHVRASARQRRLDVKQARQAGNVEARAAVKAIVTDAAQDIEDANRQELELWIAANLAEEVKLSFDGDEWPDYVDEDIEYCGDAWEWEFGE